MIQTLIEQCGFEPIKAINHTKLIHESGSSCVMVGTRSELLPIVAELAIAGLNAEIV